MVNMSEVIVITDVDSVNVFDPISVTSILNYSGSGSFSVCKNTLSFIKSDYLVAANILKPTLNIWPIKKSEKLQQRKNYVCPGPVNALAISPDGNYCVAGILEIIYIWQIGTGRMLTSLHKHYQKITKILFVDDGSHFVVCSEDCTISVWNLANALSQVENKNFNHVIQQQPLYFIAAHVLEITDMHIGKGGIRAHLTTVSMDRTCKIHDLSSGLLMLTLLFADPLTSVTLDYLDTKIYLGTNDGSIYEFDNCLPPRTKEHHVTNNELQLFHQDKNIGEITCLSVSMDGCILLSGSMSGSIFLWSVSSKQLLHKMQHKSAITNALFMLFPKNNNQENVQLIANNFKRIIENENNNNEYETIDILINEKMTGGGGKRLDGSTTTSIHLESGIIYPNSKKSQEHEIKHLKKINKNLYAFSIKNFFNSN